MQLQATDLRHRRQPLDLIDLQIGFAIARDLGELHEIGGTRHRMALEEFFTADAVGCAENRARTALEVGNHPFPDRLEILREVELGNGLAVATVGPQRLLGLRDRNTHHLGGFG